MNCTLVVCVTDGLLKKSISDSVSDSVPGFSSSVVSSSILNTVVSRGVFSPVVVSVGSRVLTAS